MRVGSICLLVSSFHYYCAREMTNCLTPGMSADRVDRGSPGADDLSWIFMGWMVRIGWLKWLD
jgi:hypothetical protein